MSLKQLKISELEKQGVSRMLGLYPELDSTVYGQHAVNLIRSAAYAAWPLNYSVLEAYNSAFVHLATGDDLDDPHGIQENLPRINATPSVGVICVYGSINEIIEIGTEFSVDSKTVITTAEGIVQERVIIVNSGAASNGLVTLQAPNHNHPVGGKVIVDVSEPLFDGERKIVATTPDTITFKIVSTAPASCGSGVFGSSSVVIDAETVQTGVDSKVTGSVKLSGDFEAFTLFFGLLDGTDRESDAAYQSRLIKKRNLIEGAFTPPQIELAALSYPGNTKAWVVSPKVGEVGGVQGQPGYKPEAGEVMVYILRDDLPIQQPTLDATKQVIIDEGKLTAHSREDYVYVLQPAIQPVTFEISNLVPDTNAMKLAVEQSLKDYIEDFIDFEDGFSVNKQISVIGSTIDAGGQNIVDFTLVSGTIPETDGTLIQYDGVNWI